ncbi:MAG: hypothetical protein HOU01_08295 [Streptomycetaceae bacterium]|nr:hypothetical protein [Streptomycetaceae bacterium]
MVVLGIVALAAAAVVAFVVVAVANRAKTPFRGGFSTCAEAAVRGGRRMVVAGVVEPLPREAREAGEAGGTGRAAKATKGLVTAPVSGRSCVWFHSTVVEHWVEAERPRVRDFDGDGPLHYGELRRARRGRKRAEAVSSGCRFVVRDATGSVVVDPRVLRAEGLPVSVRDSVARVAVPGAVAVDFGAGADRVRRSSRYERSETVLVPGQHVVISGRVRHERDGTAVLAARRVSRRAERAATGVRRRRGLRVGWLVGVLSAVTGVAALLASTRH